MSKEKCPACGSELLLIEKSYPGGEKLKRPYYCCGRCGWDSKQRRSLKSKVLGPNWIGQIKKYVRSTVTYKGKTVSKPTVRCEKCNNNIDLNRVIDAEGGARLATLAMQMNERGKIRIRWNELKQREDEAYAKKKIDDFFQFEVEKEKLWNRFHEQERTGTYASYSTELSVICQKCFVPVGKVQVNLELTIPLWEDKPRRWEETYDLAIHIPREVAAKVTSQLGYGSWEALQKYTENPDLPKLLELTEGFKAKLLALNVAEDLIVDLIKYLDDLLNGALPREVRRRKQAVIEKIRDLAKIEAIGK